MIRSMMVVLVAATSLVASNAGATDMFDPYAIPRYTRAPASPAQKEVNCSFSTEWQSRPVFTNAGIYASKYSAQVSDLYCQHQSGVYVDIWNLTPYGAFKDGGEVDVRVGWQKKFNQWSFDVSGAWYNYRVLGLGVLNNADVRGKVTYNFDVGPLFVLRGHGIADYQYAADFAHHDVFSIAGGLYGGIKLTPQVELGAGAETWKYFSHFASNPRAQVTSIGPQLNISPTKDWSLFAKAVWVNGSVIKTQDEGWKPGFGIGTSIKF